MRLDIGPEAALPIAGADTSRNEEGGKVLELFVPVGPATATFQSDDPIGDVASPLLGAINPTLGDFGHSVNLTNLLSGGRWFK